MTMAKNKPTQQATPKPSGATAQHSAAQEVRTTFFTRGFWTQYWLPALLLLGMAVGLYQASGSYGYVLDDELVIWKNTYVQDGFSGIKKIFGADSFMGYFQKKEDLYKLEGGRYRPLSLATFAMENDLWGKSKAEIKAVMDKGDKAEIAALRGRGNPQISHWINILLYGLSAILLYRVLLGFFPGDGSKKWWWSVSFWASALFLFHPLHTECVANIKGRDEIMALLGSFAALYAAMKYYDTGKAGHLAAAGVWFLLGLFSKENTLTFFAIIPLSLWFFGKVPLRRMGGLLGVLGLAALIFIVMRYQALGYMLDHGKTTKDLMNNSFLGMSIAEKTATIFLTLGWYIKLLFYPVPLTHDYYPYHVPKVGWGDWRALLSLLVYVAMIGWAMTQLKKRRMESYAVLFFVITLSIVSNLVVSVGSFMNERFVYMPSVAFTILLAWWLLERLPALSSTRSSVLSFVGIGLIALVIAFWGRVTVRRVPAWQSAWTLNESAVRNSPGSARAQSFYTTAIYQEKFSVATDPQEKAMWVDTMEYHVQKALEIYPDYGSAWVMRANIALARYYMDKDAPKLYSVLTQCIQRSPYNIMMRGNIENYVSRLAQSGTDVAALNRFSYQTGYEVYWKIKRDSKSAIQYLEYSIISGQPGAKVLEALAEVYAASGQPDKAAAVRSRIAQAPVY